MSNAVKVAAPILTVVSAGMAIKSIVEDGKLTVGDGYVAVITGVQIVFPVFGFVYGMADLAIGYATGKNITDRIKETIDEKLKGAINLKR